MDHLKRITDLFTEGVEVYLGDQGGKPIVIWVNQLNSFESGDARIDGSMRRNERMSQLAAEDSPERDGVIAELSTMSDQKIAERLVQQRSEEIMLEVYADLETDEEYRDLQERVVRLPGELDAAGAASDDPRRKALEADQERWTGMIAAAREKAMREAVADATDISREDLIDAYVEKWRERSTIEVFMVERRMTELWFAMRECEAVDVGTDVGRRTWDHSACDHSRRLVPDRPAVRGLPEAVLSKVSQALDNLRVTPREAGNSDAPASSSDSLEQASAEDLSTLSTPVAPLIEPLTP